MHRGPGDLFGVITIQQVPGLAPYGKLVCIRDKLGALPYIAREWYRAYSKTYRPGISHEGSLRSNKILSHSIEDLIRIGVSM